MKNKSKALTFKTSITVFILLGGLLIFPLVGFSQQTVNESNSKPMGLGFLVNPLGFIQFGPVFQAEFPVGSNIVVGPQLRLAGLGLLYHLMVEGYASVGGMSFGVHGKYFLENPNSPHRFYIGGSGEFGFGSNKDNVGWSDEWHGEHSYIAFLGNFGYRWRFPSGFFVNVGLFGGFGNELKDDWWYSDSPWDIRQGDIGFYLFGMVELAVGFGK